MFPDWKYIDLEIIMPDNPPTSYSPEIVDFLHTLVSLRNRFKLGLPENLVILKKRLAGLNLADNGGALNDLDLFYSVGIIFSGHAGPVSMGELGSSLEVPLSTATRIVDWLVKNGYAERLPDAKDRRIVRVALTHSGKEMYRTINEFFVERIERIMHEFTPEERCNLLSLLSRVVDALEKGA